MKVYANFQVILQYMLFLHNISPMLYHITSKVIFNVFVFSIGHLMMFSYSFLIETEGPNRYASSVATQCVPLCRCVMSGERALEKKRGAEMQTKGHQPSLARPHTRMDAMSPTSFYTFKYLTPYPV